MRKFIFCLASVWGLASAGSAATIDLNPYSGGCLQTNGKYLCGDSGSSTGIVFAGESANLTTTYRNFMLFDLSSITDTIVSARIIVSNAGNLLTDTSSEAVGMFSLSADSISRLETNTGNAGTFSDAGTGINLGFQTITSSAMAIDFGLSPLWLSALNGSAGGKFGIGGALITASDATVREGVFGAARANAFTLRLETSDAAVVPLPAGLPLLLSGLVGLGLLRRRQQS